MRKTYSAGGVVINEQGQVLVVNQNGISWSLPKGHIDEGEDAKLAAAREIKEESGITKLTYLCALGSYERHRIGLNQPEDKSELKTITMFLYKTKDYALKPEDPHNPEARWVDPDSVATLLTHPKDREFFISVLPRVKDLIA